MAKKLEINNIIHNLRFIYLVRCQKQYAAGWSWNERE